MYPEAVKDRRNSGTGPWPGNLTHAWRAGTAKGYGSSGAEDTRQTFLLCSNAGGVVKSCTSDVVCVSGKEFQSLNYVGDFPRVNAMFPWLTRANLRDILCLTTERWFDSACEPLPAF